MECPFKEREMDFQIEKNIPVPEPHNSKHHELKRLCEQMEVGDSILLDDVMGQKAAGFIRKIWDRVDHPTLTGGDRVQRKATTRKVGDMRRVWRTG
jgi:hypothetical protein